MGVVYSYDKTVLTVFFFFMAEIHVTQVTTVVGKVSSLLVCTIAFFRHTT